MSTRTAGYSGFDWGTFSVDATTAKTLNSAAASGHALDAAESGGIHCVRALLSCPAANLRYSTSNAVVTSSTGHRLVAGDVLEIDVDPRKLSFIAEVAGPSTVFVDYHANG